MWQLQPLQVGLESPQHIILSADQSETVDLLLSVRCPVIIPPTSFVLFLLGLWQFWLRAVCRPFTATPMMCLPGGPTTISLLLASLSKRLSARWWAPVQKMNHQWRYFSLGRCSSEALCIPKGASLSRIWKRCSVCLQSDSSLSGFLLEFNTQKAVGVMVGCICSEHTPGVCLYGFAQLKPVMSWEIWLFHSSLRKHWNKFQLPFGNDCSELGSTHHTDNRRERQSASWWYNYVLFIFWPDTSHISSKSPLQLLYFRHKDKRCSSTLTLLPTVDEICQTLPVVDSKQKMDQSAYTQQHFRFDLPLPYLYPTSTSSEEDVRYDVNTLHRQLYPELFEKSMCKPFFFFELL